jgi:ribosomal RNA assembly protein
MSVIDKVLKIPDDRIAILIGPNGSVKKEVEAKCNVILRIEGKTGQVQLMPKSTVGFDDSALRAIEIIDAISHGFSPTNAFKLLNDEISLLITDLYDSVGKSRNTISRFRGRIIGSGGKSRKTIEELTGSLISVYGHTVSFLGTYEEIILANDAVLLLLRGRSHKFVYQMLQNAKRKSKLEKLQLWMD